MYFKRLEMHGFKSFAEPAIIEFHEGVTCIVGPNGSGKSNISDAIRWVLGEQSPKMLRGGKMEEVIFSGTASRKSRGMAEVTLVIDNTTGILPIDYNEVAITRRMYRSGESEYLINNNQCRLRDIRELIMDTGIGVDGYSIIGQGKIADLVSNKPESRREIFEEAAGVVMYKSKKAEAERRLANANGNLERVNDIIAEIESRIDGLKDDSIKAAEYLKLRDRLKELEINITLRNIEKLEEGTVTLKNDVTEYSQNIDRLTKEKAELDTSLAENKNKNDNLEQLSNEARYKLLAVVEEISTLTNKSQLDAEKLNTLARDLDRVSEEIKVLEEKKCRDEENVQAFSAQEAEFVKELEIADKNLQDKLVLYSEVSGRYTEISDEIEDLRNNMYRMSTESSSKRSEANSLESYRESLNERKKQLEEDNKNNADSKGEYRKLLAEAETDLEENRIKCREIDIKLAKDKDKLSKLFDRNREIDKESSHLQIRVSQLSARKKTIEEMESNYEGYNGAVRFIMKSKLSGIEGVAAELMEVPSGYEVAIETALGGALQNVVCLKDNDAKVAVKALKDNKAGRLTFLPVESVKGSTANIPPVVSSNKGCRGIASELIKYDKKYEGIFRYLLGRVCIVDTMQDAIDFSKKTGQGVRFVTIEGEIVNASGAITGGKYKNATANLLERKSEISRLADEISKINIQLDSLGDEKKDIRSKAETMQQDVAKAEEEKKSLQLEEINLDVQVKNLKRDSLQLDENENKFSQQLETITKDYQSAIELADKLVKEADQCQSEAEDYKAKIEELLKEQEALKDSVDAASEDITAMRIEKTKCENKKAAVCEMMDRIHDSINDFASQIEAKHMQIESIKNEKNHILFGSDDIEALVESKTREKEDLEEYIARVTSEKAEVSKLVDSVNRRFIESGEKLNSIRDQKYQLEIRIAKNETQLDTYKEKLWEEFEVSYLQAIEYKKTDFAMSTAQKESRDIKSRLKELGDVNVGSIKEYAEVKERYEFLSEQRADIMEAMEQLQEIVTDMEKTIKTKFKDNFDKIVINFEEVFKKLFGGGHAELRLDNEENPLESGIEIIAQPPGKKLQNINLMSGGEKTMTAMALMFAVLKTTPTPFCILDEIEAALDDANIDRFAKYLRSFDDIQFAIITHQKATMEHADVLYGVTMPERGISKVLSLRLGDDFEV